MRTISSTPRLLAAVLFLGGCGEACPTDAGLNDAGLNDAGPDAAVGDAQIDAGVDAGSPDGGPLPAIEHAGLWRFTSFSTFDPGSGMTTTITRDSTPSSIRGDSIVAAVDDVIAVLDVRMGLLEDGLLSSPVLTQHQQIDLEGDRWAIRTQDGNTDVFAFSRAGETATLTYDETDPRNETTEAHPSEIILERIAPTRLLYGEWELVSLTNSGGTVIAGACEATSTPGEWSRLRQLIVVDTRNIMRQQTTRELFSDDTCLTLVSSQTAGGGGLSEDDGARATIYIRSDMGTPTTVTFDVVIADREATLTRVSCLPLPGCESSQPISVVIRRRRL